MARLIVLNRNERQRLQNSQRYAEQLLHAPKQADHRDGAGDAILFLNAGSMTIPAHGLMRCTGTTVTDNALVLQMQRPNSSFERFYYVNGSADVEQNNYGGCFTVEDNGQLNRPILAENADLGSTVLTSWFGPQINSFKLAKASGQHFQFLGRVDTSHPSYADLGYFRQVPVDTIEGTLNANLLQGSTAQMAVSGGSLTVTATDALLETGDFIPSGRKIVCAFIAGEWRPIVKKCS